MESINLLNYINRAPLSAGFWLPGNQTIFANVDIELFTGPLGVTNIRFDSLLPCVRRVRSMGMRWALNSFRGRFVCELNCWESEHWESHYRRVRLTCKLVELITLKCSWFYHERRLRFAILHCVCFLSSLSSSAAVCLIVSWCCNCLFEVSSLTERFTLTSRGMLNETFLDWSSAKWLFPLAGHRATVISAASSLESQFDVCIRLQIRAHSLEFIKKRVRGKKTLETINLVASPARKIERNFYKKAHSIRSDKNFVVAK